MPDDAAPIEIREITSDGSSVIVQFDRTIPTQRWTCVTYQPTGDQSCSGFLPADTNADGVSSVDDISSVIDNLNGRIDPPLPTHQCDVDRSGMCGPLDILRIVDLLNGAEEYDEWDEAINASCPAAP